ncbi:baseplate assembly protein W [Canicola haemoglobinophilus]|uniref:GPW/gp25 family protein n=1 Tax=Canicola haemoglobinophilus TaxID=733 RepID=A0A1V4B154_9PAST|nr:GPW/gp25 family protein [Canicola haemoglobinophilus]OOS00644.1 baseplate assembly protein W [Canicola haemoglobinophilus]STO54371.1 GPW/gp25 family protein [Canicola haemoglobinophilus]STO60163.1 GPW/gp25 family protein [Canicola haemoglobinophilus]STO68905.1 GPW/gp25 family protein [Canicola haemoglobinophilus]
MDKNTGRYCDNENAHLRQSISDILLTPIGSRIQRRDYGSYIFELIDRPISKALMLQLAVASVIALKKWEPRIEVTRFYVDIEPEQAKITANMDFIRKEDKEKINFNQIVLGTRNERTR